LITVAPVNSVAAQSSFTFSAPNVLDPAALDPVGAWRRQMPETVHTGKIRRLELLAARMRSIMVGTRLRIVGRCFAIAAKHLSASNFSFSTALPPINRIRCVIENATL